MAKWRRKGSLNGRALDKKVTTTVKRSRQWRIAWGRSLYNQALEVNKNIIMLDGTVPIYKFTGKIQL